MNTICVIGLGYIGLPTAVILATHNQRVFGVDVRESTVEAVNQGKTPFFEPDLREALALAISSGNLTAHVEPQPASTFIVAVPTPLNAEKEADLSYVEAATRSLAPLLEGGELIILESTSPPGTTARMAEWIQSARPDLDPKDVLFAHCPERVLPGRVLIELVENDRVVGGVTREAAEKAATVYRIFCSGNVIITDDRTAEMVKLVENSYRDVNIAFANELSRVCAHVDVDVWELIELANHHPRVDVLQPGPGVGGHCIAVDPWFLVSAAPKTTELIRTSREVNDSQPANVATQVIATVEATSAKTVALLGLAFKRDIDDLRESPALEIAVDVATRLPEVTMLVVEPYVSSLPPELELPNVVLSDLGDALADSTILALLVDHSVFRGVTTLDLLDKEIIDTRGLWRKLLPS